MNKRNRFIALILYLLPPVMVLGGMLVMSCGDDDPLGPPPITSVELVPIDPPAQIADLEQWTSPEGASLHFIVSNEYRTRDGFFFEGRNQGTIYEELTGRVELIKEADGWIRVGATFSYESEYADFVESILGPFAGIALDLYEPISSEPFIKYPTVETERWTSDTFFVSDGTNEYQRYFQYQIDSVGDVSLLADGLVVKEFSDVIYYRGEPNSTVQGQRPDLVEAYLAPDYGIIYALFRLFDVENACALIGYGGGNVEFPDGGDITDYFPLAPGNHWLYEFSRDSDEGATVEFRFSVVPG